MTIPDTSPAVTPESHEADASLTTGAGAQEKATSHAAHAREGDAEAPNRDEGHSTPAPTSTHNADQGAEGPSETPSGAAAQSPAGERPPGAKRKRRRRKKGPRPGAEGGSASGNPASEHASEGQASGELGDASSGAEGSAVATSVTTPGGTAEGDPSKRARGRRDGRKPREERSRESAPRERPAFNVGDVVFGKLTEITEDALFVDLSGKALAIFDRAELSLPPETEDEATSRESEGSDGGSSTGEANFAASEDNSKARTNVSESAPEGESVTAQYDSVAPEGDASAGASAAPSVQDSIEERAPDAVKVHAEEHLDGSVPEKVAPPSDPLPVVVLEVGAPFVAVVHNDGGRGGLVVLTHHERRATRAKLHVSKAMHDHTEVMGLITGVIKGGVEVDVAGLRAFAPGSHMDLRPGADLSGFVGKRLSFFVTQYGKRGRDVVLSRRAALEAEAKAQREALLAKIEPGSVVEGTVRTVVTFGAFIDIGGVEGLVPLAEMSHNRSERPSDVFKVGDTVSVKIQRIDERGKIWLSRKAAVPDPWAEFVKKYALGSRHTGKVVRLQPFGVFVELENGIDGLIHTSDLSIKRIEHPSEVVKEGELLDVVVANVDSGARKIGLHPAPPPPKEGAEPEAPQRVQVHKNVKVAVVLAESGGIVVRILGVTGKNARGFITSAATGTPRGTELRKLFPVGMQLDAKVIEIDPRRGEVKLSIKAFREDNERNAYQQYRQQVTREAKFGTFGDLLSKKNLTPKE